MTVLEDATVRATLHAEHMKDVQAMLFDFAMESDLGRREELWLRLKEEFSTAAGAANVIANLLSVEAQYQQQMHRAMSSGGTHA